MVNELSLNNTASVASCGKGTGTQEPCGHWRSHIHGFGTRNATGSVDFISSCSAFLRRHKGTHNGTRIRPIWLATLLFWMFWEFDPHLWKNNVLLQFHTRASYYYVRERVIIGKDLENRLRRGSRKWKVKEGWWGAFSMTFHERGNNVCRVVSETGSLSSMFSTPC